MSWSPTARRAGSRSSAKSDRLPLLHRLTKGRELCFVCSLERAVTLGCPQLDRSADPNVDDVDARRDGSVGDEPQVSKRSALWLVVAEERGRHLGAHRPAAD